jgi:hypothetical protein
LLANNVLDFVGSVQVQVQGQGAGAGAVQKRHKPQNKSTKSPRRKLFTKESTKAKLSYQVFHDYFGLIALLGVSSVSIRWEFKSTTKHFSYKNRVEKLLQNNPPKKNIIPILLSRFWCFSARPCHSFVLWPTYYLPTRVRDFVFGPLHLRAPSTSHQLHCQDQDHIIFPLPRQGATYTWRKQKGTATKKKNKWRSVGRF